MSSDVAVLASAEGSRWSRYRAAAADAAVISGLIMRSSLPDEAPATRGSVHCLPEGQFCSFVTIIPSPRFQSLFFRSSFAVVSMFFHISLTDIPLFHATGHQGLSGKVSPTAKCQNRILPPAEHILFRPYSTACLSGWSPFCLPPVDARFRPVQPPFVTTCITVSFTTRSSVFVFRQDYRLSFEAIYLTRLQQFHSTVSSLHFSVCL